MTGYAVAPMPALEREARVCAAFARGARTLLESGSCLLCLALFAAVLGSRVAPAQGAVATPEFSLPTLAGEGPVSLAQYRGKIVYVDFWASWCGPCRKSLPLYEAMYRELDPDHFAILAISLDEDPKDASDFLEDHPVSYTVLTDPNGVTAESWGLKAMPTSFLLNGSGERVKAYPGFETSHMEVIRNDIETLLDQR